MNQPSVFISCVSPEFRQTRSRVAAILTRLGYTPVIQEIFGTEPGDLRQVLRDKIDACEGLIQIVGQGYGAEPPRVDSEFGRISYTQFEFLYARAQKKKTWLIFAADACTRDTPLDGLDLPLPNDRIHLDPASYQAERRALQLTYRDQRRNEGHLYYDATSDTDLELKVERLRDELAKLRQAFKLWQNKVLRAFAVVFVLLALIGGSILWFGRDIHQISAEARHITREKIRAHLLESARRIHEAALAEAAKPKDWEARDRLRKAAERANTDRLSRIDELANSFAEIEGTDRSTQVFDEMTRILKEQGVDQALAYVATQRAGILETVKARAAAAREKNRADLLPLLKSAQLQADHNQPAEATRLFAEILGVAPDWPDALEAQFQFLITQGSYALYHGTLAEALDRFQDAESTVQRLLKSEPDIPRFRRDLSVTYGRIGDVQRARGNLDAALNCYKQGLEITEKLAAGDPTNTKWQRDLSVSYERIGDVQRAMANPEVALNCYKQWLEIAEKLAARDPGNTEWQRDLAVSYDAIGNVQRARGNLDAALNCYKQGLEITEKLAAGDPAKPEWQRDLSVNYERIGDVQRSQDDLDAALNSYKKGLEIAEKLVARDPSNTGWQRDLWVSHTMIGDVQSSQDDLDSALNSYKKALQISEELTARDPANTLWQRDLSISYATIGNVQSAQGDLPSALSSYKQGLEIAQKLVVRDPANTDWQRDLSISYEKIGDVLSAQGDLSSALSSYKQDLEIREKLAARDPANAQWKADLVISLWKLASILEQQGTPQKREAGINYQRALEILRPLAVENRLTAEQKIWISQLEARLKAITEEPARGPNDNQ